MNLAPSVSSSLELASPVAPRLSQSATKARGGGQKRGSATAQRTFISYSLRCGGNVRTGFVVHVPGLMHVSHYPSFLLCTLLLVPRQVSPPWSHRKKALQRSTCHQQISHYCRSRVLIHHPFVRLLQHECPPPCCSWTYHQAQVVQSRNTRE